MRAQITDINPALWSNEGSVYARNRADMAEGYFGAV